MNIGDVNDSGFLKKVTTTLNNQSEPETQEHHKDIDEEKCVVIGTLPNNIKHLHNLQKELQDKTNRVATKYKNTDSETEENKNLLAFRDRLEAQFQAVHTLIYSYLHDTYLDVLKEDKKLVILTNWRIAYVKNDTIIPDSENTLSHFGSLIKKLYF